jgi:predicted phage tail protein
VNSFGVQKGGLAVLLGPSGISMVLGGVPKGDLGLTHP